MAGRSAPRRWGFVPSTGAASAARNHDFYDPAVEAAALKSTKPGLRRVTNDRKRFELATESIPKISPTKVGLRVFHRCSFCCQEHESFE